LLNQPVDLNSYKKNQPVLLFNKDIVLHNLSFRYVYDGPVVLDGLDLCIPKGSRIGFIGMTGSGKSTLIDIIMGLLVATDGDVLVDGVPLVIENQHAWHRRIAHVPQVIYLADSSFEENIAFGVPKGQIDPERVRLAAQQAQIADYIESHPGQYQA